MASGLKKVFRSLARGVWTFGPGYLLALVGPRGPCGTKSLPVAWGRFHFRHGDSDVEVYRQIFIQKDYELSQFPQHHKIVTRYEAITEAGLTPVIIDAGANNGLSAIWFATKFPKAMVIAVEPDPHNAAVCRLNTSGLGNIKVVEAAIGSESGSVKLSNEHADSWLVQSQRANDGAVRVVTAPQLVEMAGPRAQGFMCKIDIEGFESDLFACNTDWIDQLAVIIIEPHDWNPSSQGSSLTFQRALMGWGQLLISGENIVFIK